MGGSEPVATPSRRAPLRGTAGGADRHVPSVIPAALSVLPLGEGISAMFDRQRGPSGKSISDSVHLDFRIDPRTDVATLRIEDDPAVVWLRSSGEWTLTLSVRCDVLASLGGAPLGLRTGVAYHLPPAIRSILGAIRCTSCDRPWESLFVSGKCCELLCALVRAPGGDFVSTREGCSLSSDDTARIAQARRFIEDHAAEKPSLHRIAKECGVNRAKLTSGFRQLYGCTVGQALAAARFRIAADLLLTTRHQVDGVGYRAGYENSAAFVRAFGAHFGVSPAKFRQEGGVRPIGLSG
jgi:AraC family transcriptional activator of pyochelin receptor